MPAFHSPAYSREFFLLALLSLIAAPSLPGFLEATASTGEHLLPATQEAARLASTAPSEDASVREKGRDEPALTPVRSQPEATSAPTIPRKPNRLKLVWDDRTSLAKRAGIELPVLLAPVIWIVGLLWALSHFILVAEAVFVDAMNLAGKVGTATTHMAGAVGVPAFVLAHIPAQMCGLAVLILVLFWGWMRASR